LVEGTAGGTGSIAADASWRGGSGSDWYSACEAWRGTEGIRSGEQG